MRSQKVCIGTKPREKCALFTPLKRSLLLGVGILAFTRDQVQSVAEEVCHYGASTRAGVKGLTDRLVDKGKRERQSLCHTVQTRMEKTLQRMQIATQSELSALHTQVDALTQQVAAIHTQQTVIVPQHPKEEA
ncbi:MAG: phasin family protein [Anaerolineae bacterium]|nr:phasin family protein [Anaerolineae bacterium]